MRRLLLVSALSLAATAAQAEAPISSIDDRTLLTVQGRVDDMAARVKRLEDQSTTQGVLGLLNQIDSLQNEVARLRGMLEEISHNQQIADKRQKELFADFDRRLRAQQSGAVASAVNVAVPVPVPPVSGAVQAPQLVPPAYPVTPPAAPAYAATTPASAAPGVPVTAQNAAPAWSAQQAQTSAAQGDETKAYEEAFGRFKAGDYAAAITSLTGFIKRYPNGSLAGNATYWLGLSYFASADYANAIAAEQALVKTFPQHAKVPDALFSMARAYVQIGDNASANQQLTLLIANYPGTQAAEMAKKMQSVIK